MPRLAHVTTIPETLGFFRGQIAYLKARGWEVVAVSSPGPGLDAFGTSEQIAVRGVPMRRRIAPMHDLASLARMIALMAKVRPDVVHSHTPKAGLLGTIGARLVGSRAVVSLFGLPQMTRAGVERWVLDLTTRISCALAHRVWCDSASIAAYVVEHRLCAAHKVFVAANGSVNGVDAAGRFDPSKFDAAARAAIRQRCGIPDGAWVIGFVGRLAREKGLQELTSSWRALRDRYPDMHLLLVGQVDGADPILPADDRVLRADPRVHFAGHQPDTAPLFAAMDLFVMPSYREGFGVTNIEAAALALPVVSTRIPGCVDSVIDGTTGTLVPVHDVEALTAAIEHYHADPALRRAHGAAGRARVLADFQPQAVWEALAGEYSGVLTGAAGRAHPGVVSNTNAAARVVRAHTIERTR